MAENRGVRRTARAAVGRATGSPAKSPRRFQKRARSDEDRDLVRTKIIEAAQREFSTKAVEDVSMRMIAERAGYSQGTIYQYFSNKNALLIFIKQEFLATINNTLADLSPCIADPRERLQRLIGTYHRYWVENPDTFKIIFSLNHSIEDRRMPDGKLIGESSEARRTFFIFQHSVIDFFAAVGVTMEKTVSYFLTSTFFSASHGSIALPLGVITASMPKPSDMNTVIVNAIMDSWSAAIDRARIKPSWPIMTLDDFRGRYP
jgi:AcrR family transcriptional regulator